MAADGCSSTGFLGVCFVHAMDFVEQVKNIRLQPQECIIFYDVKALFTSVPIQPAINIIKQLLEDDKELQQRTSMTAQHIICLLEFCLTNTSFIFQGRYHEQTEGAAMGSPLSPIIANLYMEAFEKEAISTAPDPLPFGEDLLMIHLLSSRRKRKTASSTISTT